VGILISRDQSNASSWEYSLHATNPMTVCGNIFSLDPIQKQGEEAAPVPFNITTFTVSSLAEDRTYEISIQGYRPRPAGMAATADWVLQSTTLLVAPRDKSPPEWEYVGGKIPNPKPEP
jgi:hypothetical protein